MVSLIKTRSRPSQAHFDELLIWDVHRLLAIGLVMVYSASIATAEASRFTGNNPGYYLMRHGVFIVVGVIAGLFVSRCRCRCGRTSRCRCSSRAACCWCWC